MAKNIRWISTGNRKHAFVARDKTSLCERSMITEAQLHMEGEQKDVERCQMCLDVLEKALLPGKDSTERTS